MAPAPVCIEAGMVERAGLQHYSLVWFICNRGGSHVVAAHAQVC